MKKQLLAIGCSALMFLSSCADLQSHQPTLQEMMEAKSQELSEMAELGSVEYTITKIIKASDASWYKFGDRKILFSCKAILKAGIDLSKFSSDNLLINEETKSITVTLPKARLLSMNLPPEETKLAYEKVSLTRSNFSAEERNKLLQQGEADIIAEVPTLGILEEAEKNAANFFKAMLSQMGFSNITIKFKDL